MTRDDPTTLRARIASARRRNDVLEEHALLGEAERRIAALEAQRAADDETERRAWRARRLKEAQR